MPCGLQIVDIDPRNCAFRDKVSVGDVMVEIDGREVTTLADATTTTRTRTTTKRRGTTRNRTKAALESLWKMKSRQLEELVILIPISIDEDALAWRRRRYTSTADEGDADVRRSMSGDRSCGWRQVLTIFSRTIIGLNCDSVSRWWDYKIEKF